MEKIFVRYINLDRRPDRNEDIIDKLNTLGFLSENIMRFSAIDGNDLINDLKDKNYFDSDIINGIKNNFPYKSCVLACLLSHYLLLKNILNDKTIPDDAIIFIFEDDFFVNYDYLGIKPFQTIINELEEFNKSFEWDLIYFGGRFNVNFDAKTSIFFKKITENFYLRQRGYGYVWDRTTHNLVVKKNTAHKIINEIYNYMTKFKNNHLEIDHLLASLSIQAIDYFPHIFYSPNNHTTDIQNSTIKTIL